MMLAEQTNIVQANFLVENRPKLTLDETRLFLSIVGSINKDDSELKPIEIPVSEFANLWGVDSNGAYRRLKVAMRGLVQKEFFVEGINPKTGKLRFLSTSYISMATYEEGAAYAIVQVSDLFRPYLLELKEKYTRYILKNVMSLSTVNAIRNYELLKQYQTIGNRIFTIEEYRKILKLEQKYARNTDLRVNVIDPAIVEINENTDIFVSYEFIGRGQKAKIKFTIKAAASDHVENPNQVSLFDEDEYEYDELPEIEDTDIAFVRSAIGDPGIDLSAAQVSEIRELAWNYLRVNKFDIDTGAETRDNWLFSYVSSQSHYVQAKGYKNFYAYLRSAIINNHAQV